jgi:serine/threonine-protein kinase RsbT
MLTAVKYGRPPGIRAEDIITVRSMVLVITSERDFLNVLHETRAIAIGIGFHPMEAVLIVAAIAELVQNLIRYAGSGMVSIREVSAGPVRGIEVTVVDHGPGIQDLDLAMSVGFSTSRGLGLGLPACRRIMDDFDLKSAPGEGTVITTAKWLRYAGL